MAIVKLFLDKRKQNKNDRFPLVIRITHHGGRKDIKTSFRLSKNEWNENRKEIRSSFRNATQANNKLKGKLRIAEQTIANCETVLKGMTIYELAQMIQKELDAHTSEKIDKKFLQHSKNTTKFVDYAGKVIEMYKQANRIGSTGPMKDAISLFTKFHGSHDLLLSEIDILFLENLEAYYVGKGNAINGLGVKLRAVRRIYNLAKNDKNTEITQENYPFGAGGYSIKKTQTKKRAVKLDVIQKIRNLEYNEDSALWHHRNYFLFMFNLRGMNFIDMAYLKLDAIKKDRIVYKRTKTKRGENVKEFNIKITDEAQKILDYYTKNKRKEDLIFPILDEIIKIEDSEIRYKKYMNKLRNHNRRLDTIGKTINLDEKLTTYVARHSFATAGLHKGISKAQIGDMLGHTNYYTTEAYLSGFEEEILDQAADKIFDISVK